LNAAVELESARLSASLNLVSKARAVAGTGAIPANEKVDARALVDIAGEVDLFGPLSLFGTVTNLFDKTYNVAFSPAGARPGAPRMAMAGVRARF
jgi:Fe(3+) dicitrate transport protein